MSEIEMLDEARRLGDAAICNAHPEWTPETLVAFATGLKAAYSSIRCQVLGSRVEDVACGLWENRHPGRRWVDCAAELKAIYRVRARWVLGLSSEGEGS